MQVSNVDKNMGGQSSTVPKSIYKEDINKPYLGLDLIDPRSSFTIRLVEN